MKKSKAFKAAALTLVMILILSTFAFIASAYSTGTYTVTPSNGVNVRSGPGTGYSIVGAATKGTEFSVSQINGSWGKTSSIRCTNGTRSGWVCLDNCSKKNTPKTYYTLTYNANGGSNAPASVRVAAKTSFKLSSSFPTRSGYSFLGWSTSKSASTASWAPKTSVSLNGNVTLYAIWLSGSVKTSYSTPLPSGTAYYISPANATGSVIEAKNGGKSSNTNIQLRTKTNAKYQQWKAVYYGSGYYYFVDCNSGLAADVHEGLALNGQNISLHSINKSDAQLFRLISAGNGYYYVQSKVNPAYYIDICNGYSSNGTNVQLYQAKYSNAQKYKFTTVSSPVINPSSLSINYSSISLNKGNTKTISATVYPSNATNKSVTWKSSDTTVATVSSSGTVTAREMGTAKITATTSNGLKCTCTVTVRGVKLETGYYGYAYVDDILYFSAKAYPSDTSSFKWSSSNTKVASVSSSGKVTAKSAGSATITAKTSDGRSASVTITVSNKNVWRTGNFDIGYVAKGYTTVTLNRNNGSAKIKICSYDMRGRKSSGAMHVTLRSNTGAWIWEGDITSGTTLNLGNDHSQYRVYIAKKQYPNTVIGNSDDFINIGKCVSWSIECTSKCHV